MQHGPLSARGQRDDDDDDGVQQGGIEDDAGALQDQNDVLTERPAKVRYAGDKHDFEPVGADAGDTVQRHSCSLTDDVSPGSHTTTRAGYMIKAGR